MHALRYVPYLCTFACPMFSAVRSLVRQSSLCVRRIADIFLTARNFFFNYETDCICLSSSRATSSRWCSVQEYSFHLSCMCLTYDKQSTVVRCWCRRIRRVHLRARQESNCFDQLCAVNTDLASVSRMATFDASATRDTRENIATKVSFVL
jgi:hypothetical protein